MDARAPRDARMFANAGHVRGAASVSVGGIASVTRRNCSIGSRGMRAGCVSLGSLFLLLSVLLDAAAAVAGDPAVALQRQIDAVVAKGVSKSGLGITFVEADRHTSTNLISNPDFEQMTSDGFAADWQPGSVYSRVTDTVRPPATAALKYTNQNPKTYQICTQDIPALDAVRMAGKRFNASAWIKSANVMGGASGATIAVEFTGPGDGHGVPGSVCINQTATGCATYLAGEYPTGVKGTKDWWSRSQTLLSTFISMFTCDPV